MLFSILYIQLWRQIFLSRRNFYLVTSCGNWRANAMWTLFIHHVLFLNRRKHGISMRWLCIHAIFTFMYRTTTGIWIMRIQKIVSDFYRMMSIEWHWSLDLVNSANYLEIWLRLQPSCFNMLSDALQWVLIHIYLLVININVIICNRVRTIRFPLSWNRRWFRWFGRAVS